jgi:glycosyltransferase involved in cell wall biosynthesis
LKILFAALTVPFPPTNGHRVRNSTLLRAMAEEGHAVSLVAFAEPPELRDPQAAHGGTCHTVDLVPAPDTGRRSGTRPLARLVALPRPLPYGAVRYRSQAMTGIIALHLARTAFDALIVDDIYLSSNVPDHTQVVTLLNKHDLTEVILERYLAHESNPAKRAYAWLECQKIRRLSDHVMRKSAGILACSEIDRAEILARLPAARVAIVPNVVPTDLPTGQCVDDGRTVLFSGSMDFQPNIDGVQFFVSKVLPALHSRVPSVRFVVEGRNPSPSLCRWLARVPGVEVTGTVPDMRVEVAKATVCVVPLRIGSGTRLKILEAGAMGKAVVSTRLGAEGLEFIDGKEIVLADEPQDLAKAVAELLADANRRAEIGDAACRRVEAEYSLSALRQAVRTALDQFCEPVAAVPHSPPAASRSLELPS